MIFKKMCHAVEATITEIHHHAFNRELAEGTLPKEKFIHYLVQDSLYLSDFSKALAITSAKLSNNDQTQQFMQFALQAMKAERDLHFSYLEENHLSTMPMTEQSPACFMYTNYLLKNACLASVEEAVASLLPCFWVYQEVGKKMAQKSSPHNPYQEWIALYSSDQFALSVHSAINITIELGNAASDLIKEKMISAFKRSTQLEWLFWNSAYYQEKWLIEDEEHVIQKKCAVR